MSLSHPLSRPLSSHLSFPLSSSHPSHPCLLPSYPHYFPQAILSQSASVHVINQSNLLKRKADGRSWFSSRRGHVRAEVGHNGVQEDVQGGREEEDKIKTAPFDWKRANKIVLTGNLGRDFEVRKTVAGKQVAVSSLAVQRSLTESVDRPPTEEVDWFTLEVWENLGERASLYLSKGKKVTVEGRMRLNMYTGRDGVHRTEFKVYVNCLRFDDVVLDNDMTDVPN